MYVRAPYRSSSIAGYVTESSTRLFLHTITQRLISANTQELRAASFSMLLPRGRMAQVAHLDTEASRLPAPQRHEEGLGRPLIALQECEGEVIASVGRRGAPIEQPKIEQAAEQRAAELAGGAFLQEILVWEDR